MGDSNFDLLSSSDLLFIVKLSAISKNNLK